VINQNSSSDKRPEKQVFRIPSLPFYWENFLVSILLLLLLPLLPLGIEWIINGSINGASLALSASMYTISIGISSKSRLIFALTIFSSVGYALLYGLTPNTTLDYPVIAYRISSWGIILTFILHTLERYNRHVADRTPFWEFMKD